MSFAIGDDDAMVGISIPDDVADNMMNDGGFGLEEGEGGFGAEESGFGHDENFEVFFEKADQPPEKRRRTLEAEADEEQARAARVSRVHCDARRCVCVFLLLTRALSPIQAEEDDELPEIERERSAAEPRDDAMEPESELEANAAFDQDFGGEPAAAFDEFGAGEDPLAGSMDEVIMDGPASKPKSRRSSMGASEAEASQSQQEAGAAKPSRKASNKRKAMTFDSTIQISNGDYKRMLQDTSAITRDLVAESTKRQRQREAPSDFDLFSGAPSLSLLPPEALELDCFQPGNRNVFGRTQRATKAAAQPADADAEGVEDEQVFQPTAEDEMGGDFGIEMGGGMEQPFGEEPLGDEEPLGEEKLPLDEEPLPSVPDTFEGGSQALPNVDGNEIGKGGKGSGASPGGTADPGAAWSARTQKMHAMLDRAFAESDGMALSFDAMVAKSKGKEKRRVVAGCFQELLFLSTHGLLELQQQKPYANIIISKAEGFDAVEVVA